MKLLFFIFYILLFNTHLYAQNSERKVNVNKLFELKVDSIERRIIKNKWGADTSFFIHYVITNISQDSLTYITNSCFYYNHYSLTLNKQKYDVNSSGGCSFNSLDRHQLSPQESFRETEWILSVSLQELNLGNWEVTLSVPLVIDDIGYRVDGRNFVENEEYLNYRGFSMVIETIIDKRRRMKRKKAKKV